MKKRRKFYLILLLGLGLITTSIMMVSKGLVKDSNQEEIEDSKDFVILDEEEPSLESSQMEDNIDSYFRDKQMASLLGEEEEAEDLTEGEEDDYLEETWKEEAGEIEEVEEDQEEDLDSDLDFTLVETSGTSEFVTMTKPLDGELGLEFTNGKLVYSKTLEEWTSHKGIDILGPEGSQVKAALAGRVTEVYKDSLWGTVVIIDHGDGFLTKYASLAHDVEVIEGSQVNQGDIIGSIGETASIEMMEESHLHFEVIKEGVNKDPLDYLPDLTARK